MNAPIQQILVVGGGTAGWLSAAYLNRALGESVSITLIESSAVPTIGVGEATIPTLRSTMEFLGFADQDWMPHVGATYKAAIKFVDWVDAPRPGDPQSFWHPFTTRPEPRVLPFEAPFFPEVGSGVSLLHYALKDRLEGSQRSLAGMLSPTPSMCERSLSPRSATRPDLDVVSAYHVDAGLLGQFLKQTAVSRGVRHVVDDVVHVQLDDRGFVERVDTKSSGSLPADLFIDCTGFRGLLINKALGEPFESDAHRLLCDSAVAIPCRYGTDSGELPPYTTSTALSHGWAWEVPLLHRNGCGYVYCSQTTTPEQAELELREFLGAGSHGAEARHLRMRVGQTRRPWVHNCVAIGLSSSFIEPLESTGIFLIEYGLANLLNLFPDRDFDPSRARMYNRAMRDMYEETRDFIILHYILTRRDDTDFWRLVRTETDVPDSLQEKIEFFRCNLPLLDELKLTMFRAFNYSCILDGSRALPSRPYPLLEHLGYEEGFRALTEIRKATDLRLDHMPKHRRHLEEMQRSAGHPMAAHRPQELRA